MLSRSEVQRLLDSMEGVHALLARLMYGTGMRLMEAVRLRVQDVDFERGMILVRDGKGRKDRVVPLPKRCRHPLEAHMESRRRQFDRDQENGGVHVYSTGCPGAEVPACLAGLALAVCVRFGSHFPGSPFGSAAASPSTRNGAAEGHPAGCPAGRSGQTGEQSRLAPFLRHPSAGSRL